MEALLPSRKEIKIPKNSGVRDTLKYINHDSCSQGVLEMEELFLRKKVNREKDLGYSVFQLG